VPVRSGLPRLAPFAALVLCLLAAVPVRAAPTPQPLDNASHLYTLDGFGGVHPDGTAPALGVSAYWPGHDLARGLAIFDDGGGGYVLDANGGLHAVGGAAAVAGPSWPNWDIARGLALLPGASAASPAGYVLDGFGGVHAFGGAPSVAISAYWPNWDIARGLGGPGGDSGVRSVVTAGVIQNVAYAKQVYALSCEAAALQMVLSHEGIAVDQSSALNAFGIDGRSGYFDYYGTLHWGDPYTSFVGSPNGSEPALTGYGTYWPRVAAVAGSQGATVLRAGTGISPQAVYDLVTQGHPVVAWIAYDWRYHSSSAWIAFDGRRLGWAGSVEHAVTVVGVSGSSVYVYNPATGPQWVSKSAFASAYATYGDMAVAVS
jgi:uncharacterized protein YvpB